MQTKDRKSVFEIDFFENLTGDIAAPSGKDIEDIGARIRAIREEKGASLEELSKLTGFEVSFLSGIESNQIQPSAGNHDQALESARQRLRSSSFGNRRQAILDHPQG